MATDLNDSLVALGYRYVLIKKDIILGKEKKFQGEVAYWAS